MRLIRRGARFVTMWRSSESIRQGAVFLRERRVPSGVRAPWPHLAGPRGPCPQLAGPLEDLAKLALSVRTSHPRGSKGRRGLVARAETHGVEQAGAAGPRGWAGRLGYRGRLGPR